MKFRLVKSHTEVSAWRSRLRRRFELIVSNDATIKEYGLNSEIRYRDAPDNTRIPDAMKLRVQPIISISGKRNRIYD